MRIDGVDPDGYLPPSNKLIARWRKRRARVCERKGHKFVAQLMGIPTWCVRCNAPNDLAQSLARYINDN